MPSPLSKSARTNARGGGSATKDDRAAQKGDQRADNPNPDDVSLPGGLRYERDGRSALDEHDLW